LGQEGGTAAAQVLFGDVNPGGKLPITFPHSVGDLPDYYNHKPSANRSYEFSTREPLFPFGYGLSYTSFKFDNLKVDPQQIYTAGTAKVSVDVTNTGTREGDEVPQMYIHQRVASLTRPVKELKGFERIHLRAGEKKTVEFTISPETLSMINVDMHKVVEPGVFEVMVGPNSQQTSTVTFDVLAPGQHAASSSSSQPDVVSNFDDLKVTTQYGYWRTSSDAEIGGASKATMEAVEGGANNTSGALKVSGEVVPGASFTWAGVFFHPGKAPDDAIDLSKKKEISFWARGDGKTYSLAMQTQTNAGSVPPIKTFVAGEEWKQYSFPISNFETDGHDITGLAFARAQDAGKFEFEIDELQIK
jgi:hypothetical protein